MGSFVTSRWDPDPAAMGPRRARRGGTYRAFVPDRLVGLRLALPAEVAADIADAERAMVELDRVSTSASGPHRLGTLARLLLRAEAVASSRIEGLVVSPRRLALADFDPALDPSGRAQEVVGNIRALSDALVLGDAGGPLTVGALCAVHQRLLPGALGGAVRTEQNWIGGYSPLDAAFVPPPASEVPHLLDDLCAYASGTDHSPLVQAALAHAWFETIHPFADGNGRTGRALLQLILRRRGLCRFVPPISLVIATRADAYVRGLTALRCEGAPADAIVSWLEFIAQCTRVACQQAARYEAAIDKLRESWRSQVRERCGALRADAATWALLDLLPAAPLLTAQSAAELSGRSERAVDGALANLMKAGVVKQVAGRLRYRLYEAVGVFDLVATAERALASPAGDTRVAAPTGPVPARRASPR